MRKIATIIMVIGVLLLLSYFLYYSYLSKKELEDVELYIESTSVVVLEEEQTEEIVTETIKEEQDYTFWIDYKAILEIPKISLKKGLVESTDDFSSINYAISIDKSSEYPNEEGNFILYAHSGSSKISFFKNLNKLNVGDEVFVYYHGTKYTYQIINKYEIEKTGKLEVVRYEGQSLITMLTCISNTNKQVVLIGKQISSEMY